MQSENTWTQGLWVKLSDAAYSYKIFICESCDFTWKQKNKLKHHVLVKHEGHRYLCDSCDICAKVFDYKVSLKRHMETMHSKQEDCVICEICSKTIKAKHFLQCHVREVHSNQLYSCEFCGKTFGSKWYLKRHAELHTSVETYACKLCGKTFDNCRPGEYCQETEE